MKKPKTKKRRTPAKLNRCAHNLLTIAAIRRLLDIREAKLLAAVAGRQSAVDGGGESCPDLSDPSAPADVYLCQLLERVRFDLGQYTCTEYVTAHNACTPPV